MNKATIAVIIVTLYAFLYYASPWAGVPTGIIFTLFILSPFVMVIVAYSVLKNQEPSKHTFDEKLYDDLDYRRTRKD